MAGRATVVAVGVVAICLVTVSVVAYVLLL